MMNNLIELKNIFFSYDKTKNVLNDINLNIEENNFYGIYGHSGSGKSTLLFIIGNLLKPDRGEIIYMFDNIKKRIGFVFQFFNLINELTILENAKLAQYIRSKDENIDEIKKYSEILGINDLLHKYPGEVSGGEKQRASILRAIVGDTKIILADEPTGSLDTKNKLIVFELFQKLNKLNKTIIVVSHEKELMNYCNKGIYIEDGYLRGEF
jgi:ABC-type lipoprotein export system ATPase subunit